MPKVLGLEAHGLEEEEEEVGILGEERDGHVPPDSPEPTCFQQRRQGVGLKGLGFRV